MRPKLIFLILLAFSGQALAQSEPAGEFRAFYATIQAFDFNSGSDAFNLLDEDFHGGGFGFVYNLSPWFGIFSDTVFLGGAGNGGGLSGAGGIDLKLINQMQGVKLTARDFGGLNLYGKAGIGFTRFVFGFAGDEAVAYQTGFAVGGGVDFKLSDGTFLFVEATRNALSLPNLTGLSSRDKWDGSWGLNTGIAFGF